MRSKENFVYANRRFVAAIDLLRLGFSKKDSALFYTLFNKNSLRKIDRSWKNHNIKRLLKK